MHFYIINSVFCYINTELILWELTLWEVDLVGVDLVGVDFVGVDLVGGQPFCHLHPHCKLVMFDCHRCT